METIRLRGDVPVVTDYPFKNDGLSLDAPFFFFDYMPWVQGSQFGAAMELTRKRRPPRAARETPFFRPLRPTRPMLCMGAPLFQ